MKLLYGGEEFCCTETKLLNCMLTLPSPKLDMIGARLGPNGVIKITIIACKIHSTLQETITFFQFLGKNFLLDQLVSFQLLTVFCYLKSLHHFFIVVFYQNLSLSQTLSFLLTNFACFIFASNIGQANLL